MNPARQSRSEEKLTAENAKSAEVEILLFVLSAFLCGKQLRG